MTCLYNIQLENFRCHKQLRLEASADWIVLAGGNGSGKTTILEAVYTATRGRSFRSTSLGDVIRHGSSQALALLKASNTRKHILGMEIQNQRRQVRLDGAPADLTAIAHAIPVEYLGGDTIQLLHASPADRRRFLDWTLFHVEPAFLTTWRSWFRAHRQRNTLLKTGAPASALAPWTEAVVEYGERVTQFRSALVTALQSALAAAGCQLIAEPKLRFRQGWRAPSLLEAFHESANREALQGRAVVGPQHDDWMLEAEGRVSNELSRGQAKLASLLLYRCQALLMQKAERRPIYLMDDLAADLDPDALSAALALWRDAGLQIWVTMLAGDIDYPLPGTTNRFHVEHGGIS